MMPQRTTGPQRPPVIKLRNGVTRPRKLPCLMIGVSCAISVQFPCTVSSQIMIASASLHLPGHSTVPGKGTIGIRHVYCISCLALDISSFAYYKVFKHI